eukprot:UN00894
MVQQWILITGTIFLLTSYVTFRKLSPNKVMTHTDLYWEKWDENKYKMQWINNSNASWLGREALPILHDGIFEIEFEIGPTNDKQIGVGLMVYPPNWGFFGYLGAGWNAWSYDPTTGDIVTETKSMMSNLPKADENNVD